MNKNGAEELAEPGTIILTAFSRERLRTLVNELSGAEMVLRAGQASVDQLRTYLNRELESLVAASGATGQQWTLDIDRGLLVMRSNAEIARAGG